MVRAQYRVGSSHTADFSAKVVVGSTEFVPRCLFLFSLCMFADKASSQDRTCSFLQPTFWHSTITFSREKAKEAGRGGGSTTSLELGRPSLCGMRMVVTETVVPGAVVAGVAAVVVVVATVATVLLLLMASAARLKERAEDARGEKEKNPGETEGGSVRLGEAVQGGMDVARGEEGGDSLLTTGGAGFTTRIKGANDHTLEVGENE